MATFAETFASSNSISLSRFIIDGLVEQPLEEPMVLEQEMRTQNLRSDCKQVSRVSSPLLELPTWDGQGARQKEASQLKSRLSSSGKPASWDAKPMREDTTQFAEDSLTDDDHLVASAREGNTGAFDQLVGRHTSRLYGLIYHMTGNHEDTNDLLQEVWTKVYRSLTGFRGASRFSTWIHSIAVNMSINFLKRRNRRQTVSLDADSDEGGSPEVMEGMLVSPHTPRTEAGISELQERLTEALNKLSAEHRAVVTMFDIQGMAHAEIGRILGVSEGTVRSRLFYAHRQLQAFLSDLHMEGVAV